MGGDKLSHSRLDRFIDKAFEGADDLSDAVGHIGEAVDNLRSAPAASGYPPSHDAYLGPSLFYYLDVQFEETMRRHATKPQANEYGRAEMSSWWRDRDYLPGVPDPVITADPTADAAVEQIMRDAGKRVLAEPVREDGLTIA
jgi:hypothetical protein